MAKERHSLAEGYRPHKAKKQKKGKKGDSPAAPASPEAASGTGLPAPADPVAPDEGTEEVGSEAVAVPLSDPAPPPAGAALGPLSDGLRGARLCYGKPVKAEGRTVIPVADVRASGGWGGLRGPDGGGGGGTLHARPVGFISIGAGESRFEPIVPQGRVARALAGIGVGTAVAGGAIAGAIAAAAARRFVRR